MWEIVALAVFILAGSALLMLFGQIVGRHAFSYRLSPTSVQFIFFGRIPLYRVKYEQIEEVRTVSFKEATLRFQFAIRIGNRLGGTILLIRRRKRLPVLITPDNAEQFEQELRQIISQTPKNS